MSKINLSPEDLRLVKKILRKVAPHLTVWAYGSRVNGGNHASSDLDLVVRNAKQLDTYSPQVIALKQAFQESPLPFLVDVMDWAALPESYRREIEKKYEIVQF